eukprot:1154560-Pelagomonas_calceolata.AAC.17
MLACPCIPAPSPTHTLQTLTSHCGCTHTLTPTLTPAPARSNRTAGVHPLWSPSVQIQRAEGTDLCTLVRRQQLLRCSRPPARTHTRTWLQARASMGFEPV